MPHALQLCLHCRHLAVLSQMTSAVSWRGYKTSLPLSPQGRRHKRTNFALNSERSHSSGCQTLSLPSPLIFEEGVDHTCSGSILECGNRNEGNSAESVICSGAVTRRFHGNTPPCVPVTLLCLFPPLPCVLRDRVLLKVEESSPSGMRDGNMGQVSVS